jgi:hypothetical protein
VPILHNPLGLEDLIFWGIGSLLICHQLQKNFGWLAALSFGATVFSALRLSQVSFNGIPADPFVRQLSYAAESALVSLFLTVMIAQTLSIKAWVKILKLAAVVNGIALCTDLVFSITKNLILHVPMQGLPEPWGILLNASMSGCLNAALFPLFKTEEKFARGLVFISVIASGRSLPIAVLFVGVAALLYSSKRYKEIAAALPVSLALGYLIKGGGLFASRGRDHIWKQALIFFRDHMPWAFGGGLGSFYVIGPTLTTKLDGVYFIWLHSDWLQIFFEQGFVGFNIILVMYLYALRRSRLDPKLFAALAAYGAFAVANMPLHYPIAGLYGAILLRWALDKNSKENPGRNTTGVYKT